jgi:hypothetical protein
MITLKSGLVTNNQETPGERVYSHSNTNDTVSGVPEADISSIRAALRRPPGHNKNEDLDEDVEDDSHMPSLELISVNASLLASSSKNIDSSSHSKLEHGIWVSAQAHN